MPGVRPVHVAFVAVLSGLCSSFSGLTSVSPRLFSQNIKYSSLSPGASLHVTVMVVLVVDETMKSPGAARSVSWEKNKDFIYSD